MHSRQVIRSLFCNLQSKLVCFSVRRTITGQAHLHNATDVVEPLRGLKSWSNGAPGFHRRAERLSIPVLWTAGWLCTDHSCGARRRLCTAHAGHSARVEDDDTVQRGRASIQCSGPTSGQVPALSSSAVDDPGKSLSPSAPRPISRLDHEQNCIEHGKVGVGNA